MKIKYSTQILKKYLQQFDVELVSEFKFVPNRKFRADYAIPQWKLLIEVEGGAFINGRHFRGMGAIKDMEKYNLATVYGWQLIRVSPKQFKKTQAIEWLELFLQNTLTLK